MTRSQSLLPRHWRDDVAVEGLAVAAAVVLALTLLGIG